MDHCEACRFQMYSQCRRYAPRPVIDRMDDPRDVKPRWPDVSIYEDGCGEFEPIPPAPPPKEYAVKPTPENPCHCCRSIDGKTFLTTQPFSECAACGATDEIPF